MNKNFKIFGVRSGMIGDMIMALPILNYLELRYPDSYKYWVIGKRFAQAAPLFLNHPMIDKIHILDSLERLESPIDIDLFKSCKVAIDITPNHPDGMPGINCFWWNNYTLCEETFRMAGLDVENYRKMQSSLQKPKLEKWFDVEKQPKTIGIWPFAAYGKEPKRSPSKDWWGKMIQYLLQSNYKVFIFGHPNDPKLYDNWNDMPELIEDVRHLSFFEQIKLSLGTDFCINTDSGSGWVIGSYGHPQISLITNHAPNHNQNLLAFTPENWAGNNINLFGCGSCDAIPQQDVLSSIKKLL